MQISKILTTICILYIFCFLNMDYVYGQKFNNINIVQDTNKIEKYKKIFAHFLSDEFSIDKDNKLVFSDKKKDNIRKFYNTYHPEYKKKDVENSINLNVLTYFIEREGVVNNKKYLEIILVTEELKSPKKVVKGVTTYDIVNEYYIMSIFPENDITISFYSPNNNTTFCFYGIITDTDCNNHATYAGSINIEKNVFDKYLKQNNLILNKKNFIDN